MYQLHKTARDPVLVAETAAILHILNETDGKLLPGEGARTGVLRLLGNSSDTSHSQSNEGVVGSPKKIILNDLKRAISRRVLQDMIVQLLHNDRA